MERTTYIVKYKRPGELKWMVIKNIIADGFAPGGVESRYFITEKRERIEMPCSLIFHFSAEREIVIKQAMGE